MIKFFSLFILIINLAKINRRSKKISSVKTLLCLLAIFFLFPLPARAEDNFLTDYESYYYLKSDTTVSVSQKITMTNKYANIYLTQYELVMEGIKITEVKINDDYGEISPQLNLTDNYAGIKFELNDPAVGEGKVNQIEINYIAHNILIKNGEVWEVNLPSMPNLPGLVKGKTILAAPISLGPLAYITPSSFESFSDSSFRYYSFDKAEVGDSAISAAFGEFQIFDFELNYHLHNPYSSLGNVEVAFPPDTAYQTVYYRQIDPAPDNVVIDQDGNWIGTYILKGDQKINIKAIGSVKIFTQSKDFALPKKEILEQNKLPNKYWESNDAEIIALASELKTVGQIYAYVVNQLSYNYQALETSTERKGALNTLANPQLSTCKEFTDLFIALCRAAGIPAREINGYAYTTNAKLKPLSLVVDILHAWPEYWDEEKKYWIPVDPTWEKTSGRNFFSRLDLNHFVFAIHGLSSEMPYPAGSYKIGTESQRDIKVEFGSLKPIEDKNISLKLDFPKSSLFKQKKPKLIIHNPGPQAKYNLTVDFFSEGIKYKPGFNLTQSITAIPPYGRLTTELELTTPKLYQFGPAVLRVLVDNQELIYQFRREHLVLAKLILFFTAILLIFMVPLFWSKFLFKLKAKYGKKLTRD